MWKPYFPAFLTLSATFPIFLAWVLKMDSFCGLSDFPGWGIVAGNKSGFENPHKNEAITSLKYDRGQERKPIKGNIIRQIKTGGLRKGMSKRRQGEIIRVQRAQSSNLLIAKLYKWRRAERASVSLHMERTHPLGKGMGSKSESNCSRHHMIPK